MIVLSGVLTPVAVVLLIIGIWTSSMPALLGALAASVLAGVFLVAAVLQRRATAPLADENADLGPGVEPAFPPMAPPHEMRRPGQ
ncbi:MAG: hypothetical protein ABIR60_01405 [Allosphingosinicella sp.]